MDDLASACVFVMKNYDNKEIGGFVNIGTGKDIKIKDLAKLIQEIVGFNGEIRYDTAKPDGTPRKVLDISKMRQLGWEPKTSLEDGIKMTYEWYIKNSYSAKHLVLTIGRRTSLQDNNINARYMFRLVRVRVRVIITYFAITINVYLKLFYTGKI